MPRRRHAAPGDAGAIRAGRASSLPPVSPIRSPDPPRLDGTNIQLSGICVLPNGDRHECQHPDLAENGYIELAAAAPKPKTGGVYLEDLFVTHAARGKGVGRPLMTRLAAIAVERGWERIDFQVLDWNPARGFYRRIGIEHLGDWLRYGGDAGVLRRLAAEDLPDRD